MHEKYNYNFEQSLYNEDNIVENSDLNSNDILKIVDNNNEEDDKSKLSDYYNLDKKDYLRIYFNVNPDNLRNTDNINNSRMQKSNPNLISYISNNLIRKINFNYYDNSVPLPRIKIINDFKQTDYTNIETDYITKSMPLYKIEKSYKNIEQESININKTMREDNSIIKIKRKIYADFYRVMNEKIKNYNLRLNEFDQKKIAKIEKVINIKLYNSKWREIILENSEGNEEIISSIDKLKIKDAIKLLDMTYKEYLQNFINNKWETFAKEEKEKQINDYKQRKYKKSIQNMISNNKKDELIYIKKFVSFGTKNKNGKKNNNTDNKNDDNTKKNFESYTYKITKEKDFKEFIHKIKNYENLNFEITLEEHKQIKKNIEDLKKLANDFESWFKEKKERNKKDKKIKPTKFLCKKRDL